MQGPWFFIGVGGTGMSAIAQLLAFKGEAVSGSDRDFARDADSSVRRGLEKAGVRCFPQDASGLDASVRTVVVSTAIEADHPELLKARELGCEVVHRSDALAWLCSSHRTIAVSGTSGKSTTTGLVFHILRGLGQDPSLLSGAGLADLQADGWIGNGWGGKGEWLVIEADESDGTLVKYRPEVGLILNVDRDHKELDELMRIFGTFAGNCAKLAVNLDNASSASLSRNRANDFSLERPAAGLFCDSVEPSPAGSRFRIGGLEGELPRPGRHNVSNALAALAAVRMAGFPLADALRTLGTFRGIWRRYQVVGADRGVTVVDDFAHNPAKIDAVLATAQERSERVLAWFQPHGFAPARFMRQELAERLGARMRPRDVLWFSEIHFAGGTVTRDISGADLAEEARKRGCDARFAADREEAIGQILETARPGDLILLMGARDPSLEGFAKHVFERLKARP